MNERAVKAATATAYSYEDMPLSLVLFRYRQNRSLGGWRAVFGLKRRNAATSGSQA